MCSSSFHFVRSYYNLRVNFAWSGSSFSVANLSSDIHSLHIHPSRGPCCGMLPATGASEYLRISTKQKISSRDLNPGTFPTMLPPFPRLRDDQTVARMFHRRRSICQVATDTHHPSVHVRLAKCDGTHHRSVRQIPRAWLSGNYGRSLLHHPQRCYLTAHQERLFHAGCALRSRLFVRWEN